MLSLFAAPTSRIVCMIVALGHACAALGLQASSTTQGSFGSTEAGDSNLIGMLYDLKQDQRNQPVKSDFRKVVAEFINSDWDESILNPYFRVTRPLYLNQLFIGLSDASAAPKEFGVEKIVEPKQWLVHYKGQVRAPESGTFRFIGLADDILAVARNGKTVLFTNHPGVRVTVDWSPKEVSTIPGMFGKNLTLGDWWTVEKGEVMDVDILIGEFPGGFFGAWLFLEKQGEVHPPATSGRVATVALPVFQVAPYAGAEITGKNPPFILNKRIWTALH
jgi:hypothetical protein